MCDYINYRCNVGQKKKITYFIDSDIKSKISLNLQSTSFITVFYHFKLYNPNIFLDAFRLYNLNHFKVWTVAWPTKLDGFTRFNWFLTCQPYFNPHLTSLHYMFEFTPMNTHKSLTNSRSTSHVAFSCWVFVCWLHFCYMLRTVYWVVTRCATPKLWSKVVVLCLKVTSPFYV